jgi:hypothetical protein
VGKWKHHGATLLIKTTTHLKHYNSMKTRGFFLFRAMVVAVPADLGNTLATSAVATSPQVHIRGRSGGCDLKVEQERKLLYISHMEGGEMKVLPCHEEGNYCKQTPNVVEPWNAWGLPASTLSPCVEQKGSDVNKNINATLAWTA